MKFTSRAKVVGMKCNKGQMDNGTAFDSTKVFVEVSLDDSKGTAKGSASVEYGFGTSVEFEKYKHLNFPFEADADFEIVTSGKVQKTQLVALRPLEVAKAPKA